MTNSNFSKVLGRSYYLIVLLSVICGGALQASEIKPDRTFIYKQTPQGELKLYLFEPDTAVSGKARPVILFFFGGGWVGGSVKQFYQQSEYFSQRGYVAISAEYRVKSRHKTSPFAAVEDGKSAVRWIREHAKKLNLDESKVIVAGGSAGGHVAACTGLISGFDAANENLKVSSKPDALILFNPVIDTTERGYGINKVGGQRKTEISPVHHVRAGIVPTLLLHGSEDKTVPLENVKRFAKLMKEAGNRCDLEIYQGRGHGFFNGSYFRSKQNDKDFEDSMVKCLIFLKSLGFPSLEKASKE